MTLEERVEQLEKTVAELEARQSQPRQLEIRTNFAPEISEFDTLSYSHGQLVKQLNEKIIPILQSNQLQLQSLCDAVADLAQTSERTSKEN